MVRGQDGRQRRQARGRGRLGLLVLRSRRRQRRRHIRRRTVATYGPGDFFGEMAIVDAKPRSATVTTTSPARVLAMFGTEFRRLQEAQPSIAAELERVARSRRLELQQLESETSPGA